MCLALLLAALLSMVKAISIVFYNQEETAFFLVRILRKSKNEVKTFQSLIHFHPSHLQLNTLISNNFSALI